MERIRLPRDQIALVAAVVLPLGVAAMLVPFRSSFSNTASALLLVAVIVAVAALGNRISKFVATISATVCFDYFLTRPYERLAEFVDAGVAGTSRLDEALESLTAASRSWVAALDDERRVMGTLSISGVVRA